MFGAFVAARRRRISGTRWNSWLWSTALMFGSGASEVATTGHQALPFPAMNIGTPVWIMFVAALLTIGVIAWYGYSLVLTFF